VKLYGPESISGMRNRISYAALSIFFSFGVTFHADSEENRGRPIDATRLSGSDGALPQGKLNASEVNSAEYRGGPLPKGLSPAGLAVPMQARSQEGTFQRLPGLCRPKASRRDPWPTSSISPSTTKALMSCQTEPIRSSSNRCYRGCRES